MPRSRRELDDFESEAEPEELKGLTPKGKKNAKHSDEVLDEVDRIVILVRPVLEEALKACCPEGESWQDLYVRPAIEGAASHGTRYVAPTHLNLGQFDFSNTLIVLDYARRSGVDLYVDGKKVSLTNSEINRTRAIRNDYEHFNDGLNERNWRQDIGFLEEIANRFTSAEQRLAEYQKQQDESAVSGSFETNLQNIQSAVTGVADTVLKVREASAARDAEQDRQLKKQIDADKAHDEKLRSQAEKDAQHDEQIARMGAANSRQDEALADLRSRLEKTEFYAKAACVLAGIGAIAGLLSLVVSLMS